MSFVNYYHIVKEINDIKYLIHNKIDILFFLKVYFIGRFIFFISSPNFTLYIMISDFFM